MTKSNIVPLSKITKDGARGIAEHKGSTRVENGHLIVEAKDGPCVAIKLDKDVAAYLLWAMAAYLKGDAK